MNKDKHQARLTLIFPAYNEENRLEDTILNYYNYLRNKFILKIVISLNGCNDNSREISFSLKKRMPCISIIENSKRGMGAAIRSAILQEKNCDYILIADCDSSVSPDQVDVLYKYKDFDIVIGSKYMGHKQKRSKVRYIISLTMNFLTNKLLNTNIKDHYCGFKLFKYKIAKDIFLKLRTRGVAFSAEILHISKKLNLSIYEKSIVWNDSKGSKMKYFDFFSILIDIIIIKFFHKL
jgi:hypothetical protein